MNFCSNFQLLAIPLRNSSSREPYHFFSTQKSLPNFHFPIVKAYYRNQITFILVICFVRSACKEPPFHPFKAKHFVRDECAAYRNFQELITRSTIFKKRILYIVKFYSRRVRLASPCPVPWPFPLPRTRRRYDSHTFSSNWERKEGETSGRDKEGPPRTDEAPSNVLFYANKRPKYNDVVIDAASPVR